MARGKKTGGRQPGSLNKATIEAKQACAELVDDPEYREKLKERLLAGKLPPAIEAMLWHYAHGRPKDMVESEVRHTYSWLPSPPPREQP